MYIERDAFIYLLSLFIYLSIYIEDAHILFLKAGFILGGVSQVYVLRKGDVQFISRCSHFESTRYNEAVTVTI